MALGAKDHPLYGTHIACDNKALKTIIEASQIHVPWLRHIANQSALLKASTLQRVSQNTVQNIV